jgi:topoisomerase-4 subunit A
MKRFAVTGLTRDKEYNLTPGVPGSRIVWFSANPNGEAEVVKVTLKPKLRLKVLQFDVDFAKLAIKGRGALGNLVTKNEVHRFALKERGASTLGGRDVWFDHDVKRLNYDGRGEYLGEFQAHDLVLVVLDNGEYYTSTFEATNHYEDNIIRLEKFRPKHVWTALLNDADQGYPYIKRFEFEPSQRKQRYLGENEKSTLIILSDKPGAMFEVRFGGNDSVREPLTIDAEEFIAVKSFKAKGKRITNFDVAEIIELEPKQVETPEADAEEQEPTADVLPEVDAAEATDESIEPERSDDEVRDEITGQQRIF